MTKTDEAILELLDRLGVSKLERLRRLAAESNKEALLRTLKADYAKSQRDMLDRRKEGLHEATLDQSRANLRVEREAHAKEQAHRLSHLPVEQRIGKVLAQMGTVMEAPAAAISQAGPISGGVAQSSPPPGAFAGQESLYDEWRERFERLAKAAEHALDLARGEATVIAAKSSAERDRRILSHEGESPAFVAFIEQVSESHVCKLRRKNDRRPSTGREAPKLAAAA